jgi:elongation factor G
VFWENRRKEYFAKRGIKTMPSPQVERLRNIVLLSHSGAGKTSLSEAVLFKSGATTRMGKVEDGNTISDYEQEEAKRGGSVQTSIIPCMWNEHKLNFLDTPGYDDFLGEQVSALQVADAAVILVAAPSGIEVGTARAWELCQERELPRMFLINKMDRENADFHRTVEQLREQFGRQCIAIQVPIGTQEDFKGSLDLLDSSAEVSSELEAIVSSAKENLLEAVAETDDDLAIKYLEGEEITRDEMLEGLKKGISSGQIVPVLASASTSNIGTSELLDAAVNYMPSPAESQPEDLPADANASLIAQVFKTTADPYVGKLSFFRVYQGSFKSDSQVWNANTEQMERVGQLFTIRGKTQEQTPEVVAGDIGAVPKLDSTKTGDTLCQRDNARKLDTFQLPTGNYTMAVYPKSKADVDKMSGSLNRIVEEDPSLKLTREPNTGEMLFTGLGDAHLDVTIDKIQRKFGAEIALQIPKVPYKETITTLARSEYKHKKQTGGHGQYGHVLLRLEPLGRGEGAQFAEEIVGGAVPREYIASVEKGVNKAINEGVVVGYPVVDVKVVLYDGSYHDVDSSGISFEIAASHAFREGVNSGAPALLEPILKMSITVPDAFTGDIIGDLNSKRGRILGMIPQDGKTVIEAEVPHAEVLRYSIDLRSMTQGRGSYIAEFDHYEEVPQHISQKVQDQIKETAKA